MSLWSGTALGVVSFVSSGRPGTVYLVSVKCCLSPLFCQALCRACHQAPTPVRLCQPKLETKLKGRRLAAARRAAQCGAHRPDSVSHATAGYAQASLANRGNESADSAPAAGLSILNIECMPRTLGGIRWCEIQSGCRQVQSGILWFGGGILWFRLFRVFPRGEEDREEPDTARLTQSGIHWCGGRSRPVGVGRPGRPGRPQTVLFSQ
jgi:hypothetical protein